MDAYEEMIAAQLWDEPHIIPSELNDGLCVMSADDAILANFYGVSNLSELVQAQARHIVKLQEKLEPGLIRPTSRVREG